MSFELHHWKTAGGHENKYECYWSAVIPLPTGGAYGHTYIGNRVKAGKGADMQKMIKAAISSILKGEAPKIWNEAVARGFNKNYAKSINQERDLIKIFLANYI
jgi:hypothetical protein